ncbi:MAG: hypothetical protein J7K63_02510 [Candidatus Marinimicrobia bacterium]|nr:hypothetical protein [Candidatus Neomarinimicrobiota bacterium]
MDGYKQIFLSLVLVIGLAGCAGHPVIYPGKMEPGSRTYSFAFSVENLFPVYSVHQSVSPKVDLNLHVGVPFWGSGFSMTYLAKGAPGATRFTKINAGYIYQQNQSVELNIVREWHNRTSTLSSIMFGPRITWILKDVRDDKALRFGLIGGLAFRKHLLLETGYTYDFALSTFKKDPDSNLPTGHHPVTGLSVRLVLMGK